MAASAPSPASAPAAAPEGVPSPLPQLPSLEDVGGNYAHVLERVLAASHARQNAEGRTSAQAKLVAVSKTKPVAFIQHLYDTAGCRLFGENYAQELVEKATALPQDIEWHFIGHLQSNKAHILVRDVPNLAVLETVDSEGLAKKLNASVEQYRPGRPLSVYLQVNTSGEESKSGTEPGEDTLRLARYVSESCPNLLIKGLMTIGKPDYTCTSQDFSTLVQCRKDVADATGVAVDSLELSMGMSSDYEVAILAGATSVRVGSSIFGPRQRKA